MPNMKWSELSSMQLGQYGEYYAKMEFTSYGYDVYTSEVDDHGVDFVARDVKTGIFFEVQVKSIRDYNTVFIPKDKMVLDEHRLICFLHFTNGEFPEIYIIPTIEWKNLNSLLVEHNYDKPEQKSKPEWGINYSKKNLPLLDRYKAKNYFNIR